MCELLSNIDHLVYAVDDLLKGMEQMKYLFGVSPSLGGHHPNFATHNALLGLGANTYLEIIAIDPSLPRPTQGWPLGLTENQESRLQTWAVKSKLNDPALIPPIFGTAIEGSRLTRAGKSLAWKLTDPWVMKYDGVLPFLIDWGDTDHPAADLPQAGVLQGMMIKHPQGKKVGILFENLDLGKDFVRHGENVEMIAEIRQEDGKIITLR